MQRQSSVAQTNYHFTSYTQENGIASSTNTGIAKDSAGFIWLFSENGLTRFDGYDFKIFRSDINNPNSISSPNILSLNIDADKNMFFQTSNSISKYNPDNGTFKKYISYQTQNYFYNWVNGAPNSWLNIKGNLVYLDAKKDSAYNFSLPEGFGTNGILSLLHKNYILSICGNKYFKFDITTKKYIPSAIKYLPNFKSNNYKAPLFFYNNSLGEACFYSFEGYFVYNEKENVFNQKIASDTKEENILPVTGKLMTENKFVFIVSKDGIVNFINTETGISKTIDLKKQCNNAVKTQIITIGIYQGSNKSIWINSVSTGIFRYNYETNTAEHFYKTENNDDNIPSNSCNYIFDEGNILWLSAPGIGLVKGEKTNALFKPFAPVQIHDIPATTLKRNIRKIKDFDKEHLLIISLDGAYLFNKKTNAFSDFINPVDQKSFLQQGALGDAGIS